jgi:hypothetical protein
LQGHPKFTQIGNFGFENMPSGSTAQNISVTCLKLVFFEDGIQQFFYNMPLKQ